MYKRSEKIKGEKFLLSNEATKIFWVAAILVGRSEMGTTNIFI
jgi:uncharacterized membrane protein